MNLLPSKKTIGLFILIFGIVTSTILIFDKEKVSEKINPLSNLVSGQKIEVPENPNWQKELAIIPETNLELANILETDEQSESNGKETITDNISKTLMSNYLSLKQSGNLDKTSSQNLVDSTLVFMDNFDVATTSNLKFQVVPDNGKISILEYGDRLGNFFKQSKPEKLSNEIKIIEEAVTNKDPQKMAELRVIAESYKKMAEEMARIPVPKSFLKAHSDMTRALSGMGSSILEISLTLEDPFRGLVGLNNYQQNGLTFARALDATIKYIKANKINYKQGSGGYYLLYGI